MQAISVSPLCGYSVLSRKGSEILSAKDNVPQSQEFGNTEVTEKAEEAFTSSTFPQQFPQIHTASSTESGSGERGL